MYLIVDFASGQQTDEGSLASLQRILVLTETPRGFKPAFVLVQSKLAFRRSQPAWPNVS
jgi:hypothetical protein